MSSPPSVVVDQVDLGRVNALEPEHDPPIAGHPHGPVTGEVPFQRMEPEAGKIHVLWAGRMIETRQDPIETRQDPFDLGNVRGRYAASVSLLVEQFQTLVPEV